MILPHESGSQEDQFDEKNGGKKSRDTIPLSGFFWPKDEIIFKSGLKIFSKSNLNMVLGLFFKEEVF
jgi:hypothetical protein